VKVIEEGGGDGQQMSLVEASRRAKELQAKRPPASIIIDDENLHEYAKGGSVIILESAPAAELSKEARAIAEGAPIFAAGVRSTNEDSSDLPLEARGEDYWRNRSLDLRRRWRRTVDQIDELELENAALRQQFYAEDDTYIRDSQVKPAWDRVLDRLTSLRIDAGRYEEELDLFVAEGRGAGALPGWLREGWELEPSEDERNRTKSIGLHEAVEPDTGLEAVTLSNPNGGEER
jgi:hypothetical protein